jgi:hypothetical protein
MTEIDLPTICCALVKNIYTDKDLKITLIGWDMGFVQWQNVTVQGCTLSVTLFNIFLERSFAKPDFESRNRRGTGSN